MRIEVVSRQSIHVQLGPSVLSDCSIQPDLWMLFLFSSSLYMSLSFLFHFSSDGKDRSVQSVVDLLSSGPLNDFVSLLSTRESFSQCRNRSPNAREFISDAAKISLLHEFKHSQTLEYAKSTTSHPGARDGWLNATRPSSSDSSGSVPGYLHHVTDRWTLPSVEKIRRMQNVDDSILDQATETEALSDESPPLFIDNAVTIHDAIGSLMWFTVTASLDKHNTDQLL